MPTLPSVVLEGKGKWIKVYTPNQWGAWALDLYPNAESLEKFKQMKTLTHLKKDDDGYYFSLRRPCKRKLRTGAEVAQNPPIVVDKDGNVINTPLGNGSDLRVELEYYSWPDPYTKQTKFAARLSKVKALTIVPLSPSTQDSETATKEQDHSFAF